MSEERSQSMTPFFTVWTGQAVSLLGSQLVQFALVWWLTETTGSATVLAGATIVALLPQILFSPFAGALVDRWNRRAVMIVADTAIALATLLLAALFALGIVEVWHVFALTFIRSLGGAFHWPAMQASTTLMVPQKHFARVAGLNQTLFGATNVISPPVGALLLQVLPDGSARDAGTRLHVGVERCGGGGAIRVGDGRAGRGCNGRPGLVYPRRRRHDCHGFSRLVRTRHHEHRR
jgi:MFS family permease